MSGSRGVSIFFVSIAVAAVTRVCSDPCGVSGLVRPKQCVRAQTDELLGCDTNVLRNDRLPPDYVL